MPSNPPKPELNPDQQPWDQAAPKDGIRHRPDPYKPEIDGDWLFLDPRDLKVDETFKKTEHFRERASQGYIELMVDILSILNRYQKQIVDNQGIETNDLERRESNLIYLHLEHEGRKYRFPFDFEFALELAPPLAFQTFQSLKMGERNLDHRNRRVFIRLRQMLERRQVPELNKINVFQDVRNLKDNIQGTLDLATLFKEKTASLNILSEELYTPSQLHFRLLRVLKVLDLPKHPHYKEAKFFLKYSYFKGSREALKQGLKPLFVELANSAETLYRRADRITETNYRRQQRQADRHRHWYGFEMPAGEHVYDQPLTELFRYWLKIQHRPFEQIQRDYKAQPFKDHLLRLRANQNNPARKDMDELTLLINGIRRRIEDSTVRDGEVHISLKAEKAIGLMTGVGFKSGKNWVWTNRLALFQLLEEALAELQLWRKNNPSLTVSDEHEAYLAETAKSLDQADGRARREYLSAKQEADAADLETRYQDVMSDDALEEPDEERLAELLALYRDLSAAIKPAAMEDMAWFARLQAAWPDTRERETQLKKVYDQAEILENQRERIGSELEDLFNDLPSFLAAEDEDLFACVDIIARRKMRRLVCCEYVDLQTEHYTDKLESAKKTGNPDEVLLRLTIMCRELRCIPTERDLKGALKRWGRDLEPADRKQYEAIIQEHRPKLDDLAQETRESMRNLLNNATTGTFRARMEAYGFWEKAAEHLREELILARQEVPRIGSVKDGGSMKQRVQAVQDAILEAQHLIDPADSWPDHLPDLIAGFETREEIADKLADDLAQNHRDLETLFKETCQLQKAVREKQKDFGLEGDFSHLDITLQLTDVKTLRQGYALRPEAEHEELQRFALIYNTRSQHRSKLFEQYFQGLSNPEKPLPEKLTDIFTSQTYRKFKTKKIIDPALMTAILELNPELQEIEFHLLARFLNHADPDQMKTTRIYDNFLELFSKARGAHKPGSPPRRIWGALQTWLNKKYTPIKDPRNYETNRDRFVADVRKILGIES
ncbi:MAG: hypothetical protein QNK37_19560 [Acidobacteriota bacterium]|nr:hypothetical protein [Acidobacteriota bacterium]